MCVASLYVCLSCCLGGGIVAKMRGIPDGDLYLAMRDERNRTKWIGCVGLMVIGICGPSKCEVLGPHSKC